MLAFLLFRVKLLIVLLFSSLAVLNLTYFFFCFSIGNISSDTTISGAWIFKAASSWKDVSDSEAEFPASVGGV